MKALKVIGRYRAPHRLAISFDLSFIAFICGAASSFALSYVIAPVCSHSLIVCISLVCALISSVILPPFVA